MAESFFFKINPAGNNLNLDLGQFGFDSGDWVKIQLVGDFAPHGTGPADDNARHSRVRYLGADWYTDDGLVFCIRPDSAFSIINPDVPLSDNTDPDGDYGVVVTQVLTEDADHLDLYSGAPGYDGTQVIDGLGGDDWIQGAQELRDVIHGGSGNDTLFGKANDDRIFGDEGDDTLDGTDGNDYVEGGDGNDVIGGWTEDDTLEGGEGHDTIGGWTGDDSMSGDDGSDLLHGQEGIDTLRGAAGLDSLFGGSENDLLYGDEDDDHLYGQDGDDQLDGGDGNDRLFGEKGNDTFFGSPGDDEFHGFEGNDLFDFRIAGTNDPDTVSPFALGTGTYTQRISAGIEDRSDPTNGGRDLLWLPHSPDKYTVTLGFNTQALSWDSTTTTISFADDGLAVRLELHNVESARFANPVSNSVTLRNGSLVVEAAKLAKEVYGPLDTLGDHRHEPLAYQPGSHPFIGADAQARGWHLVSAIELGMKPADYFEHGTLRYSFVDGFYAASDSSQHGLASALRDDTAQANALVLSGVVDGVRTLAVAFRGTDQVADFDDYPLFTQHYAKFEPLIEALKSYLTESVGGIEQILVTGHSLGAGMAQWLLREPGFAGSNVRAFTFGSPGSDDASFLSSPDPRIQNFIHTDDAVPLAGETPVIQAIAKAVIIAGANEYLGPGVAAQIYGNLKTKFRLGADVRIDHAKADSYGTDEHAMSLYVETMERLAMHAAEVGSPFRELAVLQAFREGRTNVEIDYELSLGSDGNDRLTDGSERAAWSRALSGGPDDQTVLAGGGNDTIRLQFDTNAIFRPSSYWRVDGGTGAGDTLVIKDLDRANLLLPASSGHIFTYTSLLSGEVPFAEIHRVEFLVLPNAAHSDDVVISLDGSAPHVQRPGSSGGGAAADALTGPDAAPDAVQFVLDPAFDYADAGDGDMTVTGTSQADVVLLGRGHKVVNAGDGDDIVIVNRAVGGSDRAAINGGLGNDMIYAEDGADTLDGGAGDDEIQAGGAVDVVYGGIGADVIAGDGGNDELDGGDGNDVLNGGTGADRAVGAQGDDVLIGDDGNDQLSGGAGNDTLEGGGGLDALTGGEDDDLYILGDGNDVLLV